MPYFEDEFDRRGNDELANLRAQKKQRPVISSTADDYAKYLDGLHSGEIAPSKKHQRLIQLIPKDNSWVEVGKQQVKIKDLAALTAQTGLEYALFRKDDRIILLRGNRTTVDVPEELWQRLMNERWTWEAHAHPTITNLRESPDDVAFLKHFPWQESSYIIDLKGNVYEFRVRSLADRINDILGVQDGS